MEIVTYPCHHIETSQLICSSYQLTGFFMMATVPTIREADRISKEAHDSNLLSAKSVTNEPAACQSFSTLNVPVWVFVVVQEVIS